MANRSVAHSAQPPSTREQRGLDLARERFEEIWKVGPWTWRVPSCSDAQTVYVVTLQPERCPCEDFQQSGDGSACKHLYAAWTVRAKTAPCADCGKRFRHRELVEVTEDHESLTWFVGDELCESCAAQHGVL